MSLEEAHAQKTPWDEINALSDIGIFSHLKTTYSADKATFQVVGELQGLLNISVQDTFGVIIAYTHVKNPETQTEGGEASVPLYRHPRIGNSQSKSALLDIYYNAGLNLKAIDPPAIIDDNYHYISYICKDGNIYELDGSKESSVIICKASDNTDKEVNWIKSLVEHLKNKVATVYSGLSCAAVMKPTDHQKVLNTARNQFKDLGEELMKHVTPQGQAILRKMQRLNEMILTSETHLYRQADILARSLDMISTSEEEEFDYGSDLESLAQDSSDDDDDELESDTEDVTKENAPSSTEVEASKKPEESVATETEQPGETGEKEDPKSAELKGKDVQQEDVGTSGKRKCGDDDDAESSAKKRHIKQDE